MLALLVWVAGCALGLWYIVHAGYGHFALGYVLCSGVTIWILGGANWLGQKLGNAVARRTEAPSADPYHTGLRSSGQEREALKKAASQHQTGYEG